MNGLTAEVVAFLRANGVDISRVAHNATVYRTDSMLFVEMYEKDERGNFETWAGYPAVAMRSFPIAVDSLPL